MCMCVSWLIFKCCQHKHTAIYASQDWNIEMQRSKFWSNRLDGGTVRSSRSVCHFFHISFFSSLLLLLLYCFWLTFCLFCKKPNALGGRRATASLAAHTTCCQARQCEVAPGRRTGYVASPLPGANPLASIELASVATLSASWGQDKDTREEQDEWMTAVYFENRNTT